MFSSKFPDLFGDRAKSSSTQKTKKNIIAEEARRKMEKQRRKVEEMKKKSADNRTKSKKRDKKSTAKPEATSPRKQNASYDDPIDMTDFAQVCLFADFFPNEGGSFSDNEEPIGEKFYSEEAHRGKPSNVSKKIKKSKKKEAKKEYPVEEVSILGYSLQPPEEPLSFHPSHEAPAFHRLEDDEYYQEDYSLQTPTDDTVSFYPIGCQESKLHQYKEDHGIYQEDLRYSYSSYKEEPRKLNNSNDDEQSFITDSYVGESLAGYTAQEAADDFTVDIPNDPDDNTALLDELLEDHTIPKHVISGKSNTSHGMVSKSIKLPKNISKNYSEDRNNNKREKVKTNEAAWKSPREGNNLYWDNMSNTMTSEYSPRDVVGMNDMVMFDQRVQYEKNIESNAGSYGQNSSNSTVSSFQQDDDAADLEEESSISSPLSSLGRGSIVTNIRACDAGTVCSAPEQGSFRNEDASYDASVLRDRARYRLEKQKLKEEVARLKDELRISKEEAVTISEQLKRAISTKCDLVMAKSELEQDIEHTVSDLEREVKDLRKANFRLLEEYSAKEKELLTELMTLSNQVKELETKKQEEMEEVDRRHRNVVLEKDFQIAQLTVELQTAKMKFARKSGEFVVKKKTNIPKIFHTQ